MFRADDADRDRLVAIKVFRLDLTPEQSAALVRELNTLVAAGLDHPNIAVPVAAGLDDGAAYLVQEFAIGDSLDVVLRERGPMALQDAVPIVAALAAAIDHAASRGVQHGALHMRDIIVSSDGGVRITGFGIVDALARISAKLPARPQYSSPDGASDVYSLGAIAFEMLTAKRVSVSTLSDLERAHGPELRAAFDAALASDGRPRVLRAGDFADAMRRAAHTMTPPVPPRLPEPFAPVPIEITPPSTANPVDDLQIRSQEPAVIPGEPEIDRVPLPEDPATAPRFQWLILAIFLVSAALAAVVVVMLVRQRGPERATAPPSGVAETTVDVPPAAPEPPAAASQPAPIAREPQPGSASTTKTPSETPRARLAAPASPLPRSDGAQKAVRGSLLIRSSPADADVFVDGRLSGRTPAAVRDLPLGSYTIRVSRQGYATEQGTIDLTARRPTAAMLFELQPTQPAASRENAPAGGQEGPAPVSVGRLLVQSKPPNARVFVDERPIGTTPLSLLDVPAGTAMVRIELDGYETWTTRVRVNGGEQTRVTASLERK